jgi:hypothetical protein
LRVPKIAIPGDFWHRSLPVANSIYPPPADSKGTSAIPGAALRAQSGVLPDFGIGNSGIHAA